MGSRYKVEYEGKDGWSRWVPPRMRLYKMACCDCGLVHDMSFRVVRVVKRKRNGFKDVVPAGAGYEVMFKARRNKRATAAKRRNGVGAIYWLGKDKKVRKLEPMS